MKHALIRGAAVAVVIVGAATVFSPAWLAIQSGSHVFLDAAYPQAYQQAQQPQKSQHSRQDGASAIATNPGTGNTGEQARNAQGVDLPTLVQAVSAAVSAIATILIYRVTARQAGISEGQLAVSRKQAELMNGQLVATETASKAAEQSAEAALEQAAISRLTLERTVRPVVEVAAFTYSWAAPSGILVEWHFIPVLSNAGPVGTVNALTNSNWIFTRDLFDADFDFPEITRTGSNVTRPQRCPIGANKHIHGAAATVPIECVIEAYARRGHIFVWGWVEYDDGLPGTSRHRTEFAVEVMVKVDPRVPVHAPGVPPLNDRFSVRNLPEHNGSDQECYRKPGDPRLSWTAHAGPRQDLPPEHPENGLAAGAI